MKANTFYFSHDFNTRSDEKITNLLMKWGMAGYGVFWAIVEDLYLNNNRMTPDPNRIAYNLRVDAEIVNSILNDFDLFVFDCDGTFFSRSIARRLQHMNEKSEKARLKANKRWSKDAVAMPQHNNSNATAWESDANAMQDECRSNAIKEKKEKEIKENKIKGNNIKENTQAEPDGSFQLSPTEPKKKSANAPNPAFIAVYSQFMEARNLKARLTATDAKSLRLIENYLSTLESATTGKKTALELFQFILDNWQHLNPWQQSQLQPRQINAQLPNFIETIKQHYNGTKTNGKPDFAAQAAELRRVLREKMAGGGEFWTD